MNHRRIVSIKPFLAVALLQLSGCALASDFDKATLVGEIGLVRAATLHREVILPSGPARLMIAVRNYRCAPVDATIRVRVVGAQGIVLSKQILLSQLTWSYGRDSCDAIGYLEPPNTNDEVAKKGDGSLVLKVGRKGVTYTFDAMTTDSTLAKERSAALWLIYGDRVPTARIFGPQNEAEPR